MKKILILLTALLLIGCNNKTYAPLATVKQVDINKYLGTWYEIARYDQYFERGCSNISATYSLKEDKTIKVLNRCTKEGKVDEAIGKAYAVDETNSKLKVSFFGPFYGDYWILMLDDDYTYAVIGTPSREYFWILSRTPKMEQKTLDSILEKLPALGYNKSKLIYPIQKEQEEKK
ncbi:MAG: Outer membrane lipoprotein Blc [uncultured Sulfurovum sp.]|uniref:Outer membrane lipoprotein Blc n=1 Tax=uncultured Sulfurovum sp. TaxID=269237 RepID=A0A6S6SRD2_9BACT|nr:MAG: Outer membrane lipoprotein Blc [uncultured Sulfurovum sp.]